jgi:peptidyl-prolyl cis-trans isomerase-like 2
VGIDQAFQKKLSSLQESPVFEFHTMVKRQKEKQYNSAREHKAYSELRAGKNASIGDGRRRTLPFDCCALTLLPFTTPVCNAQGIMFESLALTEFVLKHQKDPVTGIPMSTRDIVQLQMDQVQDDNDEPNDSNVGISDTGKWQCPVLNKVLGDHMKIVAIRDRSSKTNAAYVYSYQAYQELNVKPKSYIDLTTGNKFDPKKDVIVLNDPDNEDFQKRRNISTFWHLTSQQKDTVSSSATSATATAKANTNVRHSVTASRIMQQLEKEQREKKKKEDDDDAAKNESGPATASKLKIFSKDVTGVQYTTGKASGSFTSTIMDRDEKDDENHSLGRLATDEEILAQQFEFMKTLAKRNKQKGQNGKGYVKLITNKGTLLLELHCDITPRTCTNFLGLCAVHAYDNTMFHRHIPKFMIQGGKKKKAKKQIDESSGGKGKKDENDDTSLWGPAFVDEFDDRLKHDSPGIVSMANAGPNTNKRQFFITFQPCPHLDRKHSIFGKVTEGVDVLQVLEKVKSDHKNRPVEELVIVKTEIIVNPAQEAKDWQDKQFQQRSESRQVQKLEQIQKTNALLGRKVDPPLLPKTTTMTTPRETATSSTVVGRYLPQSAKRSLQSLMDDENPANQQQQLTSGTSNPGTSVGDDANSKASTPKLALFVPAPKKIKRGPPTKTTFGDFSGW